MVQRWLDGYRNLGYSMSGAVPNVQGLSNPSDIGTKQARLRRRLVKPG
jgi:hypothetical protein